MKRTLAILTMLLLAVALLTGCGANSAAYDKAVMPSTPSTPSTASASAGGAMLDSAAGGFSYAAETADSYSAVTNAPKSSDAPRSSLPENVKLIYTADISLESTEFDASAQGLSHLVEIMGGYFEHSELNNYARYRSAWYVVRVPAEQFDDFCSAVGGLGQVNSLSRSAQDVSEAYYDTESRLVTQRTKLERLQALLAQAEKMEDIITLESAISETELYIENLTGTLRRYDALVGFSTINISLSEVYKLTEVEEPVIGFGARLAAAFRTGCTRFVDGLQGLLLGFAYGWIGWLIFIAVVVAVILIVRGIVRRRRGRNAGAGQNGEARKARRRIESEEQKKDE